MARTQNHTQNHLFSFKLPLFISKKKYLFDPSHTMGYTFNKSNEVRLQPKSYLFYRIRSFGHVLKLYVCANGKTGHSKKIFSAYCRNSNAVKVFLQSLRVRHSFKNTDII